MPIIIAGEDGAGLERLAPLRPVNTESQAVTSSLPSRRRVWPYIVVIAIMSAAVSAYMAYRVWTNPVPLEVNEETSFWGKVFVMGITILFVTGCTSVGALLGWSIGYLIRVLFPLTKER